MKPPRSCRCSHEVRSVSSTSSRFANRTMIWPCADNTWQRASGIAFSILLAKAVSVIGILSLMQATADDLADVFKKVDTAARKSQMQKPASRLIRFPKTGS